MLLLHGCGADTAMRTATTWPMVGVALDSLGETPQGVVRGSWAMYHASKDRVVMVHQNAISVFDSGGNVIAERGREGSGPGEFRYIVNSGRISATRFWMWDSQLSRATEFDVESQQLSDIPFRQGVMKLSSGAIDFRGVRGVDSALRTLASGFVLPGEPLPGRTLPAGGQSVIGWSPSSRKHPPVMAVHHATPSCVTIIDGTKVDVPECRLQVMANSPGVATVVVASPVSQEAVNDVYEFVVVQAQGDTAAQFRVSLIGSELTDSARSAWLNNQRARRPSLRWEKVPRLPRVNPLRFFLVGDDGSLWVRGIVRGNNRVWQVISRMGQPIAAFELDDDVWLSDPSEYGALASRDLPNGQVVLYLLRLGADS